MAWASAQLLPVVILLTLLDLVVFVSVVVGNVDRVSGDSFQLTLPDTSQPVLLTGLIGPALTRLWCVCS